MTVNVFVLARIDVIASAIRFLSCAISHFGTKDEGSSNPSKPVSACVQ